MILHSISWNFKPEVTDEQRRRLLEELKRSFIALKDVVPGLLRVEVGAPPMASSNCDLALFVELSDRQALDVYQNHPDHLALVGVIRANFTDRRCCDIEA